MDLDERLYECGEMYRRLPRDKKPRALAALNNIEAARRDMERALHERITRWMRAAERDIREMDG